MKRFGMAMLGYLTFFGSAYADQCAVVSKDQATSFANMISVGSAIGHLCEPCGEDPLEFGGPNFEEVQSIAITPFDETNYLVEVNGHSIDLAYTYVVTSSDEHSVVATNAAFLVGCEATDVTNRFIVGD